MHYFSKKSRRKIIHSLECFHVKRMDVDSIGTFETRKEAYENGYRPCRCCSCIRKQYQKELPALVDFGRRNAVQFFVRDRCIQVYAPQSMWKICPTESEGTFALYHKNTCAAYAKPSDEESEVPGYHLQKTRKKSILEYMEYIVDHEYYRMRHPLHSPQSCGERQPPRKGTKRYRKQQEREKRIIRKQAIRSVLFAIDRLAVSNT